MTDRRGGDAKLSRGTLEAQMPRRRLEGAQRSERRKLAHRKSIAEFNSSDT
jgi:hypothetical protein